jgi:hypothetical protein
MLRAAKSLAATAMALKEVLGIYCAVRNSRQSAKVICGTLIDKGVGWAELSSNGKRQARLVCALPIVNLSRYRALRISKIIDL